MILFSNKRNILEIKSVKITVTSSPNASENELKQFEAAVYTEDSVSSSSLLTWRRFCKKYGINCW
jgi:hypothetical protein